MPTVLILEDNPGSRTALRAILEPNGYQVLEAADGPAALGLCARHRNIGLLVADVILRSNDGPEIARRLRVLQPEMPILFTSGHPLETLLNRGLLDEAELPGTTFLRKPFILRTFLDMVESLMMRTATLLVVDDEPQVRGFLCQLLARRQYRVLAAGDGVEALQVASRFRGLIHMLITDLVMPKISGIELAGRLQAERPGLKVLYISGYADAAGLEPTGSAFLAKPFSASAVLTTVEQLLDGRSAFRAPGA